MHPSEFKISSAPRVADLNVEQVADPCFARGLYPLALDAYAAQIDRLAGQRARLEKARCPEPLVETNSIGIGTHPAMLRDFGCWCEPHCRLNCPSCPAESLPPCADRPTRAPDWRTASA